MPRTGIGTSYSSDYGWDYASATTEAPLLDRIGSEIGCYSFIFIPLALMALVMALQVWRGRPHSPKQGND